MGSLQVNEVHICSAGMFKLGFLISSAQCVNLIKYRIEQQLEHGSAVLGHNCLEMGLRFDILDLILHSKYNVSKKTKLIWNFDIGIVMVGQLTIFNFSLKLISNSRYASA